MGADGHAGSPIKVPMRAPPCEQVAAHRCVQRRLCRSLWTVRGEVRRSDAAPLETGKLGVTETVQLATPPSSYSAAEPRDMLGPVSLGQTAGERRGSPGRSRLRRWVPAAGQILLGRSPPTDRVVTVPVRL